MGGGRLYNNADSCPISLVDGGGLRTHFSDPMLTLRSSGYTISVIYIEDQFISLIYTIPHTWVSAGVHTLAKKVVLAGFFIDSFVTYIRCKACPRKKKNYGGGEF